MASNAFRRFSLEDKSKNATVLEKDTTPIAESDGNESISERKAAGNPFADPEVANFYRDLYEKSQYECRQEFDPDLTWTEEEEKALYLIGLLSYVPQSPPSTYLTLSLRQIGFNPFTTNLLTIPSTAIGICTLLIITWISVRVNERGFVAMVQNLWTLPCIIALRAWSGAGTAAHAWPTFALLTTLLSYPYCHAIVTAWVSRNAGSVRTRSVSAALYNVSVQLGNIISANIYRADDKPLYHRGNSVLIAINVLVLLLFLFAKAYFVMKNHSREKKWNALTAEERQDYINNTKDEGNKRLDFRFAH